jgi:hypothetical protein
LYALSTDKTGANIERFDSGVPWTLRSEVTAAQLRRLEHPGVEQTIQTQGYCLLEDDEINAFVSRHAAKRRVDKLEIIADRGYFTARRRFSSERKG